jgi:predicted phosphodiesterase
MRRPVARISADTDSGNINMRLLLFSDLHCDAASAKRLVELAEAENVDIVVGAGDFANQRRGLRICLDILQNIERPMILVAGNSDCSRNWWSAATSTAARERTFATS